MFTTQDEELIQKEFDGLRMASLKRCADQDQYELVLKAFEFANEAHKDVRRRSGEPYILHPIAVAKIVVLEIGLGCKSICAALLHDVVEDTDYTVDDIRQYFGDRIAILVDGLTKIKTALDNDNKKEVKSLQAENFKRILLTLNDDARIVLIKLADRLHNLRTIEYMPEYKREKILSETMYLFIPLAHRLGLYTIKSEMENIWLKFKEPLIYDDIQEKISNVVKDRGDLIDRFVTPLEANMRNAGYRCTISKRMKTPYSIWKKMETKHVTFDQIYDMYAVRIIFEPRHGFTEQEQCWHIFSRIISEYPYKPERIRDWITQPKSNGYEALHLTVMAEGTWIEVQIRSDRMNSIAERGVAAHWAYKNGGEMSGSEMDTNMDIWLKHVKEILEDPDANALRFLDNFHEELLANEIYVFTPKGESKQLPKGATALDFAYAIHTKVGDTAIAAKVNMKLLPLNHILANGDQVQIITAATAAPKLEWLSFLKSAKAKNHVIGKLRETIEDPVKEGMQALHDRLEAYNIAVKARVIKKLVEYYKVSGKEELYDKIGLGIIDLSDLEKALKTNRAVRSVQMWGIKVLTPESQKDTIDKKSDYILKEDIDSGTMSFKIPECCSPIPGDSVVGFINDDNTVTVHKKSCEVANSLAATLGNKIVAVKWSKHFVMSYLARISIGGIDRLGILNDITKVITQVLGINIRKIFIESHDEIFEGYIDLYVHNTNDLDTLIDNIRNIKGVEKVVRTDVN